MDKNLVNDASTEVAQTDGSEADRPLEQRLPARSESSSAGPRAILAPVSARNTIMVGLTIVVVTFFGAGVWAATAPLASAVSAPGTVIFAGKRRSIQHLEGGIIDKIYVHEGQKVKAGDVLVTLNQTAAEATVERLRTQLDTQLALEARLIAEQLGKDAIDFPTELSERRQGNDKVSLIMTGQEQEFDERRKTLIGTIDLLNQKIQQLDQTIEGLNAQKRSKEEQVVLIREELEGLQSLLDRGLTSRSRVLALRRQGAQLDGEIGDIAAQISRSGQQISEAKLEIIQNKQKFREEVVAKLRDAESKAADLRQQLLVAKDVVNRLEIYAPQSGTIQNLAISTVGGVIGAGEVLMEIAPEDGDFLVEAQVSPLDIDNVSIEQPAEVRFTALDLRTTPVMFGNVAARSGDRIVEQGNRPPYFRVMIKTSPEEMKKLGDHKIQAGMPAEVLIQTRSRTLVNYITKPLTDIIARGMNEQ